MTEREKFIRVNPGHTEDLDELGLFPVGTNLVTAEELARRSLDQGQVEGALALLIQELKNISTRLNLMSDYMIPLAKKTAERATTLAELDIAEQKVIENRTPLLEVSGILDATQTYLDLIKEKKDHYISTLAQLEREREISQQAEGTDITIQPTRDEKRIKESVNAYIEAITFALQETSIYLITLLIKKPSAAEQIDEINQIIQHKRDQFTRG